MTKKFSKSRRVSIKVISYYVYCIVLARENLTTKELE